MGRRNLALAAVLVLAAFVGFTEPPKATAVPLSGELLLRDAVVHNTDPNLRNTETFGDGETSIAINPLNPDEIVMTAFSGCWMNCGTTNAPLFHSLDGGVTWTKQFTIPPPPGRAFGGCPCDQTVDFDRQGNLFFSSLISGDIVTGSTDDPADASRFQWRGNPAQVTDQVGTTSPDQPWMITNPNPANLAQDNVYVAYDDFATNPVNARVAVSSNSAPPNFTVDNDAGDASTSNGVNPGFRMTGNKATGAMYVIYQQGDQTGITWRLNRSLDGGATWTLNGDANGIVVASGGSRQGNSLAHKFGDVNALIGGVNHLTVDPTTGDVLVVTGTSSDPANTDGNRLALRRVTTHPVTGVMTVGGPVNINPDEDAALPSIAVTDDGTIGVFYYTFDGFDPDGYSNFSTYFARSLDGGATFSTTLLQAFTAPVKDNGNSRQRIFFDYNQTKALGQYFYGSYTGNGETFGHPNTPDSVVELDPIFFAVSSGQAILCPSGLTPTIVGTAGNDNLTGTPGDDVIFGLGGNDKIAGRGGNDIICGGDGNDELSGGNGNDELYGDDGADKLAGDRGNDDLYAGTGAGDQLAGGNGDDRLDAFDGVGDDASIAGKHVAGDTCVGDAGDFEAQCEF